MEVTIAAAVLFGLWLSHHKKEVRRRKRLARRRRLEARLSLLAARPAQANALRPSGCEVIYFPRSA